MCFGRNRGRELIKPIILVLTEGYLPGYKFGGPVRSLSNMIGLLRNEYDFRVITADHDLGDKWPYRNVVLNTWVDVPPAQVYYLTSGKGLARRLKFLLKETKYDLVYLNGAFSPIFTLLPILLFSLGIVPKKQIVLAPRGAFSPKYLKKGILKKRTCLLLCRLLRVYSGITWHVAGPNEAKDTNSLIGKPSNVFVAANVSLFGAHHMRLDHPEKRPGYLKMIYTARIAYEKNLMAVLNALAHVKGNIEYNLFGVVDDLDYWKKCKKKINDLPTNIAVFFHGPINHSDIANKLRQHHVFCMLSFAENFGHSIAEALYVGCPVIIGDQTPWRGLAEEVAGWDVPVADRGKLISVIQECVDMDQSRFDIISHKAKIFASKRSKVEEAVTAYRLMFAKAFEKSGAETA